MKGSSSLVVALLLVMPVLAGCDTKKGATAGAKTPTSATNAKANPNANDATNAATLTSASMPPAGVDASVETNSLHVSDEITRACNLPKPETKTNFAFDSSAIGEDDRTMLAAIAKCLTEGALRGKSVSLIGRADPRGEDEYNMSLGGTRSESVRRYLHDLGVEGPRMSTTSRGEIDATGKDEDGWAKDRRVDIDVAK